jgi:hypothetical protein
MPPAPKDPNMLTTAAIARKLKDPLAFLKHGAALGDSWKEKLKADTLALMERAKIYEHGGVSTKRRRASAKEQLAALARELYEVEDIFDGKKCDANTIECMHPPPFQFGRLTSSRHSNLMATSQGLEYSWQSRKWQGPF